MSPPSLYYLKEILLKHEVIPIFSISEMVEEQYKVIFIKFKYK